MMKFKIILINLFFIQLLNSQVVFEKLYQDLGATAGYDIIPTLDRGYMVTGFCNPTNTLFGQDFLFLKLDSIGEVQWVTNYGMNSSDYGNAVVQVEDSGYVVSGFGSTSQNNSDDVYLVKIDKNGSFVWEKTFGTSEGDAAFDLVYTPSDSGFVIVGQKGNNPWVLKSDKFGDTLWSKTFTDSAVFNSVILTSDNGILMVGNTSGFQGEKGYIVKTDFTGILQWKTYLIGDGSEILNDVKEKNDGNYILTGGSLQDEAPPFINGILRQVNSQGDSIWYKTYGGPREDFFNVIEQNNLNEIILVGNKNIQVQSNFNQKIMVVKTNEGGDVIWQYEIGENDTVDDYAFGMCKGLDSGYVICGTKSPVGEVYVYVIKIGENGNHLKIEEIVKWTKHWVFPNPFTEQTTIMFEASLENDCILTVHSNDGKLVYKDILTKNEKEYTFNRSSLKAGYYTMTIHNGKSITTTKIIIN